FVEGRANSRSGERQDLSRHSYSPGWRAKTAGARLHWHTSGRAQPDLATGGIVRQTEWRLNKHDSTSSSEVKRTTRWLLILILSGLATVCCSASAPSATLQAGHYLIEGPKDGRNSHASVEAHVRMILDYFADAAE